MAKKTTVTVVDDIDGSTENVSTHAFSFQGKKYEIDLSEKNARELERLLAPYIENATSLGRQARKPVTKSAYGPVREWLEANGYTVPSRGRYPKELIEAYESRNKG